MRGNHYNIKSSVRNTAAQAARAETNRLLPLRDVKSAAANPAEAERTLPVAVSTAGNVITDSVT